MLFLPFAPATVGLCELLVDFDSSTGGKLFALEGVLSVWEFLRPPVSSRFFYGPAPALASRVVSFV